MIIAVSARSLTRPERRLLDALVDQQFWCWGQDIRRPEGNLLLAFGFERTRPPAGVLGSSCYRLAGAGREVVLWGWGLLLVGPAGGVFLPRHGFAPRPALAPLAAPCWSPEGLPPLGDAPVPGTGRWFQAAADWIADYEAWVLATVGLAYRRACAAGSPRATFGLFPERLPALWRHVGERIARALP
ncbi:MAG: hypothetical protein RMM58_01560 [Chloroflexota bacterium]|nr:hypothetical protein [Dehalococcoidia bacterium]MDW8252546.1 hypothetical protein [Chloroflexota bacterium]